jgi:hypothetical protein
VGIDFNLGDERLAHHFTSDAQAHDTDDAAFHLTDNMRKL